MEPVRVPVTLSPHIVNDKPRGYYLLAQRIFPQGAPILRRQQFVGFNGRLIVTVSRHRTWDNFLKMGIHARELDGQAITWLDQCKLYPMAMGFRMYIPGTILKPASAGSEKVESIGILREQKWGGNTASTFYLEIQKIDADILLSRKELK